MSDYGYPKFGWMAHVAEDDRLTHCHARILMYIANQNVHGGDDWFCVRQATIAAKLHKRRQTVGDALRRARELGWLELAAVRPRGPGWHRADTYRLTTPELGTSGRTSFDQSDVREGVHNFESDVSGEDELGTRRGSSGVRGEDELRTVDGRQNGVPPAVCDTLQGEGTGLKEPGFKSEGLASDDPAALHRLFNLFSNDGLRAVPPQQAALPAPPRRVQSTRPLTDDERCSKHETPTPGCPECWVIARARGKRL